MRAFVTVGSTRFDALIQEIIKEDILLALSQSGYDEVSIQCGNSSFEFSSSVADGSVHDFERAEVSVSCWKFKPNLEEEYEEADLIISHAGSGTILDVLRKGKRLIVVPNETLLDNHQRELAIALEEKDHLKSSTIANLARTINEINTAQLTPFPAHDGKWFAGVLDVTMGFI